MIDCLLSCPERTDVVELASEPQRKYVTSLLAQRVHSYGDVDVTALSARDASAMITTLKAAPCKPREITPAPSIGKAEIGIYRLGDEIFRTQRARAGHYYMMRLTDIESGAWTYAPGALRRVMADGIKLTLAECEELSSKIGACCACGRTLTATVDGVGPAARFIGPVCARKMGF